MQIDAMNISELMLQGADIQGHLEEIARLRLSIFREYPYLYDGKMEYELKYLQHYASKDEATVIVSSYENQLAGAVTAIPLQYESEEMIAPVAATSYPVERIYYIGELLFYPDYRNKGLGTRLLSRIEQHVLDQQDYDYLVCATVMRPEGHPLIPAGYVPIERFLQHNRFAKLPGVTTHSAWKETDGIRRHHEMQFWLKALER